MSPRAKYNALFVQKSLLVWTHSISMQIGKKVSEHLDLSLAF